MNRAPKPKWPQQGPFTSGKGQAHGKRGDAASDPGSVIVCKCNSVTRAVIEEAIRNGAHTMNEIFDATTAGVGPCGGSCRRKLQPMLDHYLETGTFPEKISEDRRDKK